MLHPDDQSPQCPYEAPAVLEDLPLEAYSLACDKNPGPCEDEGGSGTS
jgi:hypothetical protein